MVMDFEMIFVCKSAFSLFDTDISDLENVETLLLAKNEDV